MWISKLWLEDECGYRHITDGQEFSVEGASLTALFTPGHATDHCVFWNKATGACFSVGVTQGERITLCPASSTSQTACND